MTSTQAMVTITEHKKALPSEQYEVLDVTQWKRQQHFAFFQNFAQSFFSIGCDLAAKGLFEHCKIHNHSFFAAYMYLTQRTINQLEPFCLRIVDDQVRHYQRITLSCAMLAEDQTFRFCDIPYGENFGDFTQQLEQAKQQALSQPFVNSDFSANQARKATVYMSVIPWVSFTSFSHASHSNDPSGIPRIVFGKMRQTDFSLPFAIDAHHSLVDGLHVGQFIEILQGYFDDPVAIIR